MSRKLYLQLNEPGAGEITLPLDTAQAANIAAGSWVPLDYKGTILGGFWAEKFEKVVVGSGEKAGRQLKVSGRGALAILEDAVVWDWGTPDLDNTRYFYSEIGGRNFTYPMHHKGDVLHQLIHEAIELQTSPYGDTLDRQCWHDSGGTHLLTHAFSETVDSDGTAWDAAENEELQARVGTTILELARQYSALGQSTPPNVFDIEAVHDDATGIVTFKIHQLAIGVSLANANVHFRSGHNCIEVSDSENNADVRNAILTEFSDPSAPYTTVTDGTSITAHRRREMLLQAANASSSAEATKFGQAQLNTSKDPKKTISMKITDGASIKYGTNYHLGDWIYYDDGTGTEVAYRIVGIQLEWDDNWFADVVVELSSIFMENEIRSARDLRKVGAQASGSSLMAPVSGAQASVAYLTHPPSGDAGAGKVLTADGLGRSGWSDVDGGSLFAGGTEHIIHLLHFDGDNDSTTVTDDVTTTWTVNGDAKLKTAYLKIGLSSIYFDGVGDYIAATIAALGSGDMSIECWVYPTALNKPIWMNGTGGNETLSLATDASGHVILRAYFTGSGTADKIITVKTIAVNEWSHIRLVRSSGVFYIYVKGFRDANTYSTAHSFTATNLDIGRGVTAFNTVAYYQGYADEFVEWNYAPYTGYYFDPPVVAYILSTQVLRGTVIKFRRGLTANLPSLYPGEPFKELDGNKALYIGPDIFYPGLMAPAAEGVTNGNNHDHSGGDGAQIAYGSLSGLPTIREVLTGDVTYYVRADGNDGNTGKVDNAGGAFLTPQKACDTVATLDLNKHNVIIQIRDGTFAGFSLKDPVGFWGAGCLTIQGNSGTPANVVISAAAYCITANSISSLWYVKDMKVTSSGSAGIFVQSAFIVIGTIDFGACATYHIMCSAYGHVACSSNYTISGAAAAHICSQGESLVEMGSMTVTFSANLAFVWFAFCGTLSIISLYAVTYSLAGHTITGSRYYEFLNSVINTNGGGANYFPGDSAGTSATGAQYA